MVSRPQPGSTVPPSVYQTGTVNRYLKHWGYDLQTLTASRPAVRFQADHSNECWHFDLSPSDLGARPPRVVGRSAASRS
jgi:hypothetical protein